MRFRYKKLILIFTLAIMFIGFGTFSLITPSVKSSLSEQINKDSKKSAAKAVTSLSDKEIKTKITELITEYYNAKQKVDLDTLSLYVSDISKVDEKLLVTEANHVEEYKNIECIVKETSKAGEYRVYVYYDIKIYDIDELVPSLTAFYVTSDEAGEFKIYLGSLDTDTQKIINEFDNSKEIKKLINSVQNKLQDILSTNSEVKEFYEMLEETDEDRENVEDNTDIHKEGSKVN